MITIDYEDVFYEDLPVDAQLAVTGIDLVVAGEVAGREPDRVIDSGVSRYPLHYPVIPYAPLPVVYKHRDEDHDQYHFIKSEKLADYFNPFVHPLNALGDGQLNFYWGVAEPNDPIVMQDGSNETFITNSRAWDPEEHVEYNVEAFYDYPSTSMFAGRVVGWRMVYAGSFTAPEDKYYGSQYARTITMIYDQKLDGSHPDQPRFPAKWTRRIHASWDIPDTEGEIRDIYAVFPPPVQMAEENTPLGLTWNHWSTEIELRIVGDEFPAPGSFRLYQFYPLVVDEEGLQAIAQASVIKPALRPGRIFVKGYVPVDDVVLIEGFPGGNIVAVTKGFEYTHTKDQGLMTTISLEQDSILSERDYGQRRRAIEEMVNRKIAADTYSVMMGSRK